MSKEVQDKTYRLSKKPKSTRRLPHSTREQDKRIILTEYESDSAIDRESPPVILERETKKTEEQGMARDTASIDAIMRLMLEDRERHRKQQEQQQKLMLEDRERHRQQQEQQQTFMTKMMEQLNQVQASRAFS